jgi:hypothetical protein
MLSKLSILLATVIAGNACAIERPNPSLEKRVALAELVVVVDGIKPLPRTAKEFDKFYRVQARVAGVLKGKAAIGKPIEVLVDNSISELRNNCCTVGQSYVLFLRQHEGRYVFVGSPNGAIPLNFQKR